MSKFLKISLAAAALTALGAGAASAEFGLGRPATDAEIAAWDIDVRPDGQGLPEGSGDVYTGEELYLDQCAVCHGDFGEGAGRWPVLAGGQGTLDGEDPVKTIGSYWPYLSTVFDYVNRAMPFGNAQSLEPDEVYAITAYLLYLNDMVDEDFELSSDNFTDMTMPNEANFIPDQRPDTPTMSDGEPCMENCKPSVEITMLARVLDVTPDSEASAETEAVDPGYGWGDDPEGDEPEGDVEAAAAVEDAAVEEIAAGAAPAAETSANADAAAANADESAVVADAAAAPDAEPEALEIAASEEAADIEEEVADAVEPAAPAIDADLAAKGERVFRQCRSCHQVGDSARNRTGPILSGVVGRAAGAAEGFRYSSAMADSGVVWTPDALDGFLANPRRYMRGTSMSFRGLRKEDDRAGVIEYLRSFSD